MPTNYAALQCCSLIPHHKHGPLSFPCSCDRVKTRAVETSTLCASDVGTFLRARHCQGIATHTWQKALVLTCCPCWHCVQATVQGTATPTTGSEPSSSTPAPETSAPAPSSGSSSDSGDSGSSTNVGAIVGGVVGGVVGLALIAGGVFYWMRRRSANAAGRVDSVSNPVYDATATGELWRS